jgi:ADP-ribose pyrophosphatase YjhB (NUDIX family)
MSRANANGSFLFLENNLGEYLIQIMGSNYQQQDRGKFFWPGGRENPGESPPETAAREAAQETGLIVSPHNIRWLGGAAQSPSGQAFICHATIYEGVLKATADREIAGRMFMSVSNILKNRDKFQRPALYLFILFMRCQRGLAPAPCMGRISRAIEWPAVGDEERFVLPAKGS